MIKKQLFYLFYIFCSFTLLVCGEKNISPNLTNSQEPEPEPDQLEKEKQEPEPDQLEKEKQEPEPLGKKIRSRSRLKKNQEQEPLKKLPAPQP